MSFFFEAVGRVFRNVISTLFVGSERDNEFPASFLRFSFVFPFVKTGKPRRVGYPKKDQHTK